MKVDGTLNSLVQGVSQQPPRVRVDGQCTLQENFSSNAVEGLTRRPGTVFVGDLFNTSNNVQFGTIKHNNETFVLATYLNTVRVFDLTSDEVAVVGGTNAGYITEDRLVFTTLDDTTYIANTAKVCALETELPNFIDYGCLVQVRGGAFSQTYKIKLDWKDAGVAGTARTATASYTTSDTAADTTRTTRIAQELVTSLNGAAGVSTNFDVFRNEDVIYIQWKSGSNRKDTFTVTATDSAGNNNIVGVANSIRLVSQLPTFAPHGYFVTVTGDGSQVQDDYYLEFSVTPNDQGLVPVIGEGFGLPGKWIETTKSKQPFLLDRSTMPHILKYNAATDEFNFSQGPWEDRAVGDNDSNPVPSFVGNTINDLNFFQGRLTILSGAAVVMSRTNKPYNFWAETAIKVTDTDPIDMKSTSEGTTVMRVGIPHNRDFVIFSDTAQFVVLGRNALTPSNSSLILTTNFEAQLKATPVAAGSNIFFGITYGSFSGVREFYTSGSTDINDARPITQHVVKYIEGDTRLFVSSSTLDVLLVLAENRKQFKVYEYIFQNGEKVQSSWSTWSFAFDIYHAFFKDDVLYIIFRNGNSYFLERLNFTKQDEPGVYYNIHLDSRVPLTGVRTSIVNPLPHITDLKDLVIVQAVGCPAPGMIAEVSSVNNVTGVVTFRDDLLGGRVIVGTRFKSTYIPTMPSVKDRDGRSIGTGSLVIQHFIANCKESGEFMVRVLSRFRGAISQIISGRLAGSLDSVVGKETITTESHIISFRENKDNAEIEFSTDQHTPLTIMDIEWRGNYVKTGSRV